MSDICDRASALEERQRAEALAAALAAFRAQTIRRADGRGEVPQEGLHHEGIPHEGLCVSCGETIAPARLQALGGVTLCLTCQSEREVRR